MALPPLLFVTLAAAAKPVRCTVRQTGTTFTGPCIWTSLNGHGRFSIRMGRGGQIVPGVTDLSVQIVAPGTAEVRGLTVHGIHSRWGSAIRSSSHPSCWQGADFEICAD